MEFGVFISPIHSPREDPTVTLHRDVELVQHLDHLGFEEIWCGEHHSTGWETIPSPEMFLAYAAAKTQRIRLGSGVISLPYHHPCNAAERMVLLDHLTRGRAIFGVGPGALPSDAEMFGLEPSQLRPMLEDSIDVVVRLLRGEAVTRENDYWRLNGAKLQILPYQRDFEMAVTCLTSPAGAKLAGRHGASLLSLSATAPPSIAALRSNWTVMEEESQRFGHVADRRKWRLVTPMHVAETREQARADVRRGLPQWIYYMTKVSALGIVPDSASTAEEYIDALIDGGFAVIGTPDDAADQIQRLQDASGGFGKLLLWAHDWASWEATLRSYRLFATEVAPRFKSVLERLVESEQFVIARRTELYAKAVAARVEAQEVYQKEKAAYNRSP